MPNVVPNVVLDVSAMLTIANPFGARSDMGCSHWGIASSPG
jgi:hypothetical protein